jgi:hypothetical protein
MSDTQLVTVLGGWWTNNMELPNDDTMEMNVRSANDALHARGLNLVMLDCRDVGDELEWLVRWGGRCWARV